MNTIVNFETAFAFIYACIDHEEESPADLFGNGCSDKITDFADYLLKKNIITQSTASNYKIYYNAVELYDQWDEEYSNQVKMLTGDNLIVYGDDDDNKIPVLYAALMMADPDIKRDLVSTYGHVLRNLTLNDVVRYSKFMPNFPMA